MKNQDDPSARAASRARHARSSAAKMAEALNLSRSMIERTRRLAKLASPELLERMRDGGADRAPDRANGRHQPEALPVGPPRESVEPGERR